MLKVIVKDLDKGPVVQDQKHKTTLSLSKQLVSFIKGHIELNCL